MARYLTLLKFTEQGARNIKKSTERALAFRDAAKKAGVTVETQLWTVGVYDGALVLSGEEKNVLRIVAELASLGNVRTETLQAFDADQFKGITG
jgi:uncharacterized protein with GYD domain